MTSTHETIDQLLARMRLLEKDHSPEGWPAVQMKDVTALCDEIERLRKLAKFPKTFSTFHENNF